ncbi:MAG: hypothetical protein PHQ27_00520 [Victivallales bacterium]|nr:hypothetical protein [Victivallales bacterium]
MKSLWLFFVIVGGLFPSRIIAATDYTTANEDIFPVRLHGNCPNDGKIFLHPVPDIHFTTTMGHTEYGMSLVGPLDMKILQPENFRFYNEWIRNLEYDAMDRVSGIIINKHHGIFKYNQQNIAGKKYYTSMEMSIFNIKNPDKPIKKVLTLDYVLDGTMPVAKRLTIDDNGRPIVYENTVLICPETKKEEKCLFKKEITYHDYIFYFQQNNIAMRYYYQCHSYYYSKIEELKPSSVPVKIERLKKIAGEYQYIEVGAPGKTTRYEYYENPDSDAHYYGKIKKITTPDGHWTHYEYFADGCIRKVTRDTTD